MKPVYVALFVYRPISQCVFCLCGFAQVLWWLRAVCQVFIGLKTERMFRLKWLTRTCRYNVSLCIHKNPIHHTMEVRSLTGTICLWMSTYQPRHPPTSRCVLDMTGTWQDLRGHHIIKAASSSNRVSRPAGQGCRDPEPAQITRHSLRPNSVIDSHVFMWH